MHRHCYETIVCLENGKQVICLDIPDSVQTLGPQMIVAHVLGMTSQQLHGLPLKWELKSRVCEITSWQAGRDVDRTTVVWWAPCKTLCIHMFAIVNDLALVFSFFVLNMKKLRSWKIKELVVIHQVSEPRLRGCLFSFPCILPPSL